MFGANDKSYYLGREKDELALARAATDPAAKKAHEELAARYRGLALAAEFGERNEMPPQRMASQ